MTASRTRTGAWSERDIGDQSGRTVVVTGANSGLGLRSATVLAGAGARVLLACRAPQRAEAALRQVPRGEPVALDLADLASVRAAAAAIRERAGDRLDVLLCNAGVMGPPFGHTADGFETQFGTNHLGHAALTWLLMPALRASGARNTEQRARVVTVSSLANTGPGLDTADPNFERRRYRAGQAYSQSKLANLVFALELDRRLRAAGSPVRSLAAHPGMTDSELLLNAARNRGGSLLATLARPLNTLVTQSTRRGTLPQLYAAASADAEGGHYYGPRGPWEIAGAVGEARIPAPARDRQLAERLWDLTAQLTGVTPAPA